VFFLYVLSILVEIEHSQRANISSDSRQLDDISMVCFECPTESAHQPIQGQATTSCLNCKFLTSQVAKLIEKCDKLIKENKQLRSVHW
jgi:formate dehydrogenase assembly factor FdhD